MMKNKHPQCRGDITGQDLKHHTGSSPESSQTIMYEVVFYGMDSLVNGNFLAPEIVLAQSGTNISNRYWFNIICYQKI
jgi:hypothetical protein